MNALELKVPPLLVALLIAIAMWLASTSLPALSIAIPWRTAFIVASAVTGLAFAVAGVVAFRKARTTVNPTTPQKSSSVVTTGVYRLSRNPMYLGFLLFLAAWAIALSNAAAFLLLPVFVAYMNRFQISVEERALLAHFGDEYLAYMRSVRRWL